MLKYLAFDTMSHKGIIIVSLNMADVVMHHTQTCIYWEFLPTGHLTLF